MGRSFGKFDTLKPQPIKSGRKNDNGPVASFSLGLVADRCGNLALGTLFSSVDNEEQRRIHSYTPEVKRLPQRGTIVRCFEETTHLNHTRVTHWPRLCALYRVAWPAVPEWRQCLRLEPPSCLPCCKPLRRYTSPRCPPSQMYCGPTKKHQTTSNLCWSSCYCEAEGELEGQTWRTYKAMRPSDAMLNTTLPMAATPTLRPCVREEKARGSTLPMRPDGDLNWGDEHGPKAGVLRLASIERSRRAFTFPCRDTDVTCVDIAAVLLPSSDSNWDCMGPGKQTDRVLSSRNIIFQRSVHVYDLLCIFYGCILKLI